ncbi:MAG TPA: hypothetical protein VF951_04060, partial [Streptosporangiaceae bacterium]
PLQRVISALSLGAMAAYAVELLNLAFGPAFIGSASFQILGSLVLLVPVAVLVMTGLRPPAPVTQPRAPR